MAYYLVRARVKAERLDELRERLRADAFVAMRPFGESLTKGLLGLRRESDDGVIWEEEDYCSPPLAMERAAVLDQYFDEIRVERVAQNAGWQQIQSLPRLFPELKSAV